MSRLNMSVERAVVTVFASMRLWLALFVSKLQERTVGSHCRSALSERTGQDQLPNQNPPTEDQLVSVHWTFSYATFESVTCEKYWKDGVSYGTCRIPGTIYTR